MRAILKWIFRPSFDLLIEENERYKQLLQERDEANARLASRLEQSESDRRIQKNAAKWLMVEVRKFKTGEKAIRKYENILEGQK